MIKDEDYKNGLDHGNRRDILQQIQAVKDSLAQAEYSLRTHPNSDALLDLRRARTQVSLVWSDLEILYDYEDEKERKPLKDYAYSIIVSDATERFLTPAQIEQVRAGAKRIAEDHWENNRTKVKVAYDPHENQWDEELGQYVKIFRNAEVTLCRLNLNVAQPTPETESP